MDENQDWRIAQRVAQLSGVAGVAAIALGGSRANGTYTTASDIDLGVYYHADVIDTMALKQIGAALDDQRRPDALTDPGEWGPWINGGGWLTVDGQSVDILYRDLDRVAAVIADCRAGSVQAVYQPVHPFGFVSAIYLAEVAVCQPLWEGDGELARLKALAEPYPSTLRRALLARFWEAEFSLRTARKAVGRGDVAYVAGSLFRCVAILAQVVFALNERYWLNEKGAVALAATMPRSPERLAERVAMAFAALAPDTASLTMAIEALAPLVAETQRLIDADVRLGAPHGWKLNGG